MAYYDQVDRIGQEKFLWAMQAHPADDEYLEDKWRDRCASSKRTSTRQDIEAAVERANNATIITSTFLPDVIITDPSDYSMRMFEAAVGMGKINGVDEMWEEFRLIGKGGPSHMSDVLNLYIQGIMQEAFAYDGDVLRCTSQEFTIIWKEGGKQMSDCVHQAVDCSLGIVKSFASVITDSTVKLSVSVAICVGNMCLSLLGTPACSTYLISGDTIENCKENAAGLNDSQILIDNSAWEYLNSVEYVVTNYDVQPLIGFIVKDFSTSWRSVQRNTDKKMTTQDVPISYDFKEINELRPSIKDAITMKLLPDLKRFIYPPLMKLIDTGEPIDVLVRMRYSVIMACRFEFESLSYIDTINSSNYFYKMLNKIIRRYDAYIFHVEYCNYVLKINTIFGIYGDTQDANCSNALKAATKCFRGSENVENVLSLSMAVSSGWLFMGPVGHNMRREQCFVGATIQRASKQALIYLNKVTCDKETFLRSNIETRNFILEEKIEVDIQNISEIGIPYQYVEFDTSNRFPKLTLNKYPLLDRVYETETFRKILSTFITTLRSADLKRFRITYEPSALYFLNDPCSGNTRLIEELISLIPPEVQSCYLRLTDSDKYVPYQTIYLIFIQPLGIAENSMSLDRETKLTTKLRGLPVNGLESILNPIFRVNFPRSSVVENLEDQEYFYLSKDVIRLLCRVCFARPWIILIDRAENIDDNSWKLMYTIMETHLVFLVAAIGCRRDQLSTNANTVVSQTKAKCIQIQPINKLFHTTLACQLMDVLAIPVGLEKFLHDHSGGNPGWIQKFLFSMVDQNVIEVANISSSTDIDVVNNISRPQKEYLSRDTSSTHANVKASRTILRPTIALCRAKWEIFLGVIKLEDKNEEPLLVKSKSNAVPNVGEMQSIKSFSIASVVGKPRGKASSQGSVSIVSSFGRTEDKSQKMDVCLISDGGIKMLKDLEFDFVPNKDYRISAILDILSSVEMYLLKCAAVIGEYFLRDMLTFIMEYNNELEIARICKNLFELKIIACAEGDFRKPLMKYAPPFADYFKVYDDAIVQCNCIGYSDSGNGCAKYSKCGYMRFVNTRFRKIIYNLLTPTQITYLHSRTIDYLEKKTMKCNSCGNGPFTKILGNYYDQGILTKQKGSKVYAKFAGVNNLVENWDVISHKPDVNNVKRINRVPSKTRPAPGASLFAEYRKSHLNSAKTATPRTFKGVDFSSCECSQILRCLYIHLIPHYTIIGNYDKLVYATLEYSQLCIEDGNVTLAMQMLNFVLDAIQGSYKDTFHPGEIWKYNAMKGRILTQIGSARLVKGQSQAAYKSFEEALSCYGYTLPKPSSLRNKITEFTQFVKLTSNFRKGIGSKYGYAAQFVDGISNCLYNMCKLFTKLQMWDYAYITALWSLKNALMSEKSFVTLMNAFSALINVCGRMRKYGLVGTLEVMSLDYCWRYTYPSDLIDIRGITKLYAAIFKIRLQRAQLEDASVIGFTLDKLTKMVHFRLRLIKVFPLFFEQLLLHCDMKHMINALASFQAAVSGKYNGDVWIHSMTIYFHLQTGCMLADMEWAQNNYYTQRKRLDTTSEGEAIKRYFVAIWLWYLRTENYNIAYIWHKKLPKVWKINRNETVNNLITTLMYIEGLLIILTQKMDKHILLAVQTMYKEIGDLFQEIEEQAMKVKFILPRLYHLKAYFAMCRMEEEIAWKTLNKATKMAQSSGNMFDEKWAQHSEKAWRHDLCAFERTWWKDHANINQMEDPGLKKNKYNIMYYTLELPLYV